MTKFSTIGFSIFMAVALPVLLMAQPKKQQAGAKAKPVTTKRKPVMVADTAYQPFQLTVHAKGFKDSMMAIIVGSGNNQRYQGPKAYLKNEKVVLQGTIPSGDVYFLVMTDNKVHENDRYQPLYLDNQHSEIEIDRAVPNAFTVVNGEEIQVFSDLLKTFGPHIEALNQLGQMKEQYQASGKPTDSLNQLTTEVSTKINEKIPDFVTRNATSPVSAYLLYFFQSIIPVAQLQQDLTLLKGDAALMNDRTTALQQYVQQELFLAAGRPAPEFTQTDTLGKLVSLASFKGKYVLVDFWASWCRPCRMENPNVVNAYNQYKAKNFTILSVSLDQDRSRWMQAIHDDGLTWTHVSDLKFWSNAVAQQYKIQSIPQNVLIGPDGKIIAKNLRGGVLDSYLKDLLK